jgi:hypothetical protein
MRQKSFQKYSEIILNKYKLMNNLINYILNFINICEQDIRHYMMYLYTYTLHFTCYARENRFHTNFNN